MKPISFWHRLLDLVSPRLCVVCGQRLTVPEEVLCSKCNLHLPRTDFHLRPSDNEMARLFWGQIPVERAVSLFFYEAQSESARLIYELKYGNRPDIGTVMGRLAARTMMQAGFFDGIDGIVPVPLAKRRQRQRGYNQSVEIARGVGEVTDLPVWTKVVRRTAFEGSQTRLGRWQRQENVEQVFALSDADTVRGRHVLIVDDVVTTGATITACVKELTKVGDVKVSVLTLGFAKS